MSKEWNYEHLGLHVEFPNFVHIVVYPFFSKLESLFLSFPLFFCACEWMERLHLEGLKSNFPGKHFCTFKHIF
jgi:hypothetical protein